jgi:hypothetical protein
MSGREGKEIQGWDERITTEMRIDKKKKIRQKRQLHSFDDDVNGRKISSHYKHTFNTRDLTCLQFNERERVKKGQRKSLPHSLVTVTKK